MLKNVNIKKSLFNQEIAITLKTAKISWLKNGDPYSELFEDYYFSTDGGFIETEYVFLKHNGFPQRFYDLALKQKRKQTDSTLRIGETGFGTGLNFLVSAYHWLQVSDLKGTLNYTSVEKYPLTKPQLKQVYAAFNKKWPQLAPFCTELLKQYPEDISSLVNHSDSHANTKQYQLVLFGHKIHLNLLINDATAALKQLLPAHKNTMDAWYMDGFAPAKNPDMWQQELFQTVAKLSKRGATLSTFTAAGFVRRSLTEAGFTMSKAPGLGKKREILYGVKR